MSCQSCGRPITPAAQFCGECGAQVGGPSKVASKKAVGVAGTPFPASPYSAADVPASASTEVSELAAAAATLEPAVSGRALLPPGAADPASSSADTDALLADNGLARLALLQDLADHLHTLSSGVGGVMGAGKAAGGRPIKTGGSTDAPLVQALRRTTARALTELEQLRRALVAAQRQREKVGESFDQGEAKLKQQANQARAVVAKKIRFLEERASWAENNAARGSGVEALETRLAQAVNEELAAKSFDGPSLTQFNSQGGLHFDPIAGKINRAVGDLERAREHVRGAAIAYLLDKRFDLKPLASPIVFLLQVAHASRWEAATLEAAWRPSQEAFGSEIADLRAEREQALAVAGHAVDDAQAVLVAAAARWTAVVAPIVQGLPVSARPNWDETDWEQWEPPDQFLPIHLGTLVHRRDPQLGSHDEAFRAQLHLVDSLLGHPGIDLRYREDSRGEVISIARSILLRGIAAAPPGMIRLSVFDPLGLGEAVAPLLALGDRRPDLLDGKVWTSTPELLSRLENLTAHIEMVIQKYLRSEYESIADYNRVAGAVAEPLRVLVLVDYPAQLDERTQFLVNRIIQNGPRCGVFTLLLTKLDQTRPHGVTTKSVPTSVLTWRSSATTDVTADTIDIPAVTGVVPQVLMPDRDPIALHGASGGQPIYDRIIGHVARQAEDAGTVTIDVARTLTLHGDAARNDSVASIPKGTVGASLADPTTWWRNTTEVALAVPFGQSGARKPAVLRFDSEISAGALLVGRPGSGKSSLVHAFLASACTLYSPEELELYLIDFKEGVEFKAYAEHGLPHARAIAVQSEREFGLSVLESVVLELKRRAELLRATGGAQVSFAALRAASSEQLPRLVLVFDEFHVLFNEQDQIGLAAAGRLETIIRQGRGFGIHVLLGSQSLSGTDALGRHVLPLLSLRVLLSSAEADARALLGDRNDGWRHLNRPGEGILNAGGGAVEANEPFQSAFEDEAARTERLAELRSHADAHGFNRRPVVFEGHAAARFDPDLVAGERTGPSPRPLLVGLPLALSGPVEIALRRDPAANVLIVAKEEHGTPLGLVVSTLMSVCSWGESTRVEIVDFTSIDDGFEDRLAPLLDRGLARLSRRRRAPAVLAELAAEVRERLERDDQRSPSIMLVLLGIHRARDLEPAGGIDFDSGGEGLSLIDDLRTVLTDGPEHGVHVVAWVDSPASLERRLPRDLVREFVHRVVGPLNRSDSEDLVGTDLAAGCRDHQIVLADDERGTARRATTFAAPEPEELERILDRIGRR